MLLCSAVLYLTLSTGGDAFYGTILTYVTGAFFGGGEKQGFTCVLFGLNH